MSSNVDSLLGMSAEIRNKIYNSLCGNKDPICLYFYQDPTSNTTKPVVPFPSSTSIPISFFSVCRQINAEASSFFYSSNTFLLNKQNKFAFFIQPCFIGTLLKFLSIIGSRASLVRNIAFDKLVLCNNVCHSTYTNKGTPLFNEISNIMDVTALLRQSWNLETNFKIHFMYLKHVGENATVTVMGSADYARAVTIINIVESLLNGELGLRKNSDLIRGVSVKLDGSGGLVSWNSTSYDKVTGQLLHCHSHAVTEFVAKDGGKRLELAPQALCAHVEPGFSL
jgi:hypothetical protein